MPCNYPKTIYRKKVVAVVAVVAVSFWLKKARAYPRLWIGASAKFNQAVWPDRIVHRRQPAFRI